MSDTPIGFTSQTGGPIVQIVNATFSASATGTTTLPRDNTIPQITEGDEYMTLAITPKSSSNIIQHTMTAGTTSSTTFRVRVGGDGAGTTTFNGASGARLYGGITYSSIVIWEYRP